MIRVETIQIPFEYATGRAGSRFLSALRDDQRILGSRCDRCGYVSVPYGSFCAICSSSDLTDIGLGPDGMLVSWTDVPDRGTYALVQLDGADAAFVHRLVDPAPGRQAGMRVRARFVDQPIGSINDLEGFVIVGEET